MDCRWLNLLIFAYQFPIPRVSYILDCLASYLFFSVCDFSSGFWQCPLDFDSRRYTAFATRNGLWQWCVCPQGIKTGPAWFSYCVSVALKHLRYCCLNYFDDIVIFSNNKHEHFFHVELVMKALKDAGFKITAKKSFWFKKEIALLGYLVSGRKVRINPEKIRPQN